MSHLNTQPPKKLNELSDEELKHLKLVEEIKALKKPMYKDPPATASKFDT